MLNPINNINILFSSYTYRAKINFYIIYITCRLIVSEALKPNLEVYTYYDE